MITKESMAFFNELFLNEVKVSSLDPMKRYLIAKAFDEANLSNDERQQVGAIIYSSSSIHARGYNGTPVTEKNQGSALHKQIVSQKTGKTNPWVLHAEEMALINLIKKEVPSQPLTLFVTHCPCERCMARIIASGVIGEIQFVYDHDYNEALNLVEELAPHIKVTRIDLEGKSPSSLV